MKPFPFILPESLAGYLESFDRDNQKAIKSLKSHLKRRGPDAVGYFLLAWLHHLKNDQDNCNLYALKAKCFAPGSDFFENLPYYFSHPDLFNAWKPNKNISAESSRGQESSQGYYVDVDSLITRLESVSRTKQTIELSEINDKEESTESKGDYLATPTLALIYTKQKHYEKAIQVYTRLASKNSSNKKEYLKEIEKLKQLIEEDEE